MEPRRVFSCLLAVLIPAVMFTPTPASATPPSVDTVHADIPGVFTNTVTGKTLVSTGLRNITRDLITGEFKSTATNVHVIVPGQGTVQLTSGLVSIDEFGNVREVGRQDPEVTPALCQALS